MGDGDAGLRELDRVGLALVAQEVALLDRDGVTSLG
jgi:hypothetical protein